MEILKHPQTTRELGKPLNWNEETHGPCDTLPIVDVAFDGLGAMCSFWKPSVEELETLNKGGSIQMSVYGNQAHPVVSISISEFGI